MNRHRSDRSDSARSPFAGCAILIAALAMLVFLVGFSIVTLFRQFAEIEKFTAAKPVPVAVTPVDDAAPAVNRLAEKIETFRQQLAGDDAASLALDTEEINLAIASYDAFKELRGTFRVEKLADGRATIAISFPLNGKPRLSREDERGWLASDPRFLNATMIAAPVLQKREIALRVADIQVPGATVPREFIDQMSPYRVTERYLQDPVLGPAMARLTRVEVVDDQLVLSRTPGEEPLDSISDTEVDSASRRLFAALGVAACVFLAFAAAILLIGLRAKRRKEREP